jgi:hypothetical protein
LPTTCILMAECVFACFYLLDDNLSGMFGLLNLLFNNFSWTLESRNCSPENQHIFSYFQLLILVAGVCFPKPTPTSRCKHCAESIQWTTTQKWHWPVLIVHTTDASYNAFTILLQIGEFILF